MRKTEYKAGDKIKGCVYINEEAPNSPFVRRAKFLCHCGKEFIVGINALKNGKSKSCGCVYKSSRRTCNFIHGHAAGAETTEYKSWVAMKDRCHNPNNEFFGDYGGRGISVCERWTNSFQNFLEDMGLKPSPKHSIDRFPDVNGNYCPENCRWGTKSEQANNKRSSIKVEYNGETKTIAEWAISTGIRYKTLHKRLQYFKWDISQALVNKKHYGGPYHNSRNKIQ